MGLDNFKYMGSSAAEIHGPATRRCRVPPVSVHIRKSVKLQRSINPADLSAFLGTHNRKPRPGHQTHSPVCESPKISKIQAGIFDIAGRAADIRRSNPAARRNRVAVLHQVCGNQYMKTQKSKHEIPAVRKPAVFRLFAGCTAEIQDPAAGRSSAADRHYVCEGQKFRQIGYKKPMISDFFEAMGKIQLPEDFTDFPAFTE